MILLLDNYDSFTYNLVQEISEIAGEELRVFRNDAISVEDALNFQARAIVISPGPGRPAGAGITEALIRSASGIPLLGICLGHQALAEVHGGRIIRGREPVHGKVSDIFHDDSVLFEGIPSPFKATRYHSLVVRKESLPPRMKVSAWTSDGVVMAIEDLEEPHFGLQFHPESYLSRRGRDILARFLILAGIEVRQEWLPEGKA